MNTIEDADILAKNAWEALALAFPILKDDWHEEGGSIDSSVAKLISRITPDFKELCQDLVINLIEEKLRKDIVPIFWCFFSENSEIAKSSFEKFHAAVTFLHSRFEKCNHIIDKLIVFHGLDGVVGSPDDLHNMLKQIMKAILLSQLPINHQFTVSSFYQEALKMRDPEESNKIECCGVCQLEENCCKCGEKFEETNRLLGEMDLLESLASQSLTNITYNYIENHIQKVCKNTFDTSHLENLEQWLQCVVIAWLKKIYFYDCGKSKSYIDEFDQKLINYMYKTYTRISVDQLFNIIIEYPDSIPALEDLKICLDKTDMKSHLTKTLQTAMENRLLHPGVSTSDILTAYIATIRSLRTLNQNGNFLETITQPIHQYLRGREDTIRCVVSSLTDEGTNNDLAEELALGETVHVDENTLSQEDTNTDWQNWNPAPINTLTSFSGLPRSSDIISMLVNVYGSKELFVNEYRTLLADRLLSHYFGETEKEIRYLELLKLRFGDSQLHYCEVMLKDVADSKRINQNIKQDINYSEEDVPMSAMIVSAQFWPAFKDENLELHKKLTDQMNKYTSAFETLKGNRTLCWKNHLGIVDLEIELFDRTLNLSVSPMHATILMHFQDQKSWSLEALSKVMHVTSTVLKRKLSFWKSHGVLMANDADVYSLKEQQEDKENVRDDVILEDYELESAMASAQDQREEELQTFWSYILGMLMNLDTLPLERIYQMLKMFAFQGPTIECSLQELKMFLDRKVKDHQLLYSNGLYKLPK